MIQSYSILCTLSMISRWKLVINSEAKLIEKFFAVHSHKIKWDKIFLALLNKYNWKMLSIFNYIQMSILIANKPILYTNNTNNSIMPSLKLFWVLYFFKNSLWKFRIKMTRCTFIHIHQNEWISLIFVRIRKTWKERHMGRINRKRCIWITMNVA